MDRIRRNERMAAMMKMLSAMPNRICTLSSFCEQFGTAKSTMSEDVDLLDRTARAFDLGRVETVTGAAGGVRYRPLISRKKAEDGGDGILYDTGHVMFCTHGHVWHEKNLPPLRPGDLLLHGHTHIPGVKRAGDIMILNPGSVSIPKEGSAHSCAVLEDGIFSLKTLGGETYLEQDLDFL